MRRLFALAVLLAGAAPTLGAECAFVDNQGDRLVQQPGQVIITNADGSDEECTLKGNGPGNPILTGICGATADWPYFMISSVPAGDPDIVIFMNTAWYQTCP